MKIQLNRFSAAGLLMAGALMPAYATAEVHICTFPGSPSTTLDRAVAKEAFKTAGIASSFASHAIGDGDDDGVSLKELNSALGRGCDVIAGFPRSTVADGSGSQLRFSNGYLRTGYVSVEVHGAKTGDAAEGVVAATYASPAQLIAVQQSSVRLDLENTPEQTVDAVATGHAQRAIVWYPAVVAYGQTHPQQQFDVANAASPYADWHLVFAFGSKRAALQARIDSALAKMTADGRLVALTRNWTLPEAAQHAQAAEPSLAYRDGPAPAGGHAQLAHLARLAGATQSATGRFIRVSDAAAGDAPSFDHAQVEHGKSLYAASCAKCHGAKLQGVSAPTLSGPAFAPAANSHLTIGGVFGYMATNMPADRPGKLKDQDYADLMAFLLYSNGYRPSTAKLTADTARASATPLNAGPQR